ncbi:hypothetical protein F4814DRAFT_460536 [Daldinia grandis]|nr:hypothetical protein F4814DRAFT_460536 [Daldinia grandis]
MDPQACFPLFSHLPQVIQDKIWTVVLETRRPTAYFLGIEAIKDPKEDSSDLEDDHSKVIFKRLCLPHQGPPTLPPWNDIETLLQTSQGSRAAVTRYRQTHQHTRLLELAVSRAQYMEPKDNKMVSTIMGSTQYNPTTKGFPGISLDASSDLVILDTYWSRMVLRHRHRHVFLERAAVRFIAIPMNRPSGAYLDYVSDMLKAFPDISVLYIVVDPEQLEAFKGDWQYDRRVAYTGLQLHIEENYKHGMNGKHTCSPGPKRFYCFGREYFEISPVQLTTLGGVVSLLDQLLLVLDTIDMFRVRIMSWQNEA